MVTSFCEITSNKQNTPVEVGCVGGAADDNAIKKKYCWGIRHYKNLNKIFVEISFFRCSCILVTIYFKYQKKQINTPAELSCTGSVADDDTTIKKDTAKDYVTQTDFLNLCNFL